MNKVYKLLAIAIIGSGSLFSVSSVNAQAVEQGNILIDTYYGFPNLTGSLIKSVTTSTTVEVSSIGPVGGKFEYMVSDKMGVGIESNYSSTTAIYDEYDEFDSATYSYTYRITSMRFMPRFNIHFGSSDSFDGYFGIAAGYLSRKYSFETTDPSYQEDEVSNPIPFALRLAVGGRYYFTENIGIHMELGFGGGAIIHGGASFKF